MKKKKLIIAIVEGTSDQYALDDLLNQLTSDLIDVKFAIVRGDILQQDGVTNNNILSRIKDHIEQYLNIHKLKRNDILSIIHIVDIDGVFLDENKIIHKDDADTTYTKDGIVTAYKDKIILRNKRKRQLLNLLSTKDNIWSGIPYSVYYFSCNLEWVLYDITSNLSMDEKNDLAIDFHDKYEEDIQGFLSLISDPLIAAPGNYEETWNYIKDVNSRIERKSNLHIFIESIISSNDA